ncbi:hypothetical protein KY284_004665 [Solanum tuberosum]|nr:hypothetical protein KY284_004665 [Solanum tuberosum]
MSLMPAGFVRAVEEPEIQKSSCFAKGVMQLITVTVCSLHTRTLAVGLIFAPKTNCHSCCSNVPGNGLSVRHRGTVVEVFEGSSVVFVALDDGKNLELGKQGICFVSQKQKR